MSEQMTSNKPYLVRAFYDWISDNGLTPYIAVDITVYGVIVPQGYAQDDQIILNIASSAVGAIAMGDDLIEFSARFGGKLEHLVVPYGAIAAIYAKENGAGTGFAIEHTEQPELADISEQQEPEKPGLSAVDSTTSTDDDNQAPAAKSEKPKGRPSLKVIK